MIYDIIKEESKSENEDNSTKKNTYLIKHKKRRKIIEVKSLSIENIVN